MRVSFPFGLSSELKSHVTYEKLVNALRVRTTMGRRFKVGQMTSQRAIFYYGNVGSTRESLGYRRLFLNEVGIIKGSTQTTPVVIKFRIPNLRIVGLILVALFILFFSLKIMPEFGIKGAFIAIALVYFGIVIDLNSQLYYFKDELESIENGHKAQLSTISPNPLPSNHQY